MEEIFDFILSSAGSFSLFAPLIFKYTLIISLSTILSIFIYYYKRSWGRFIIVSGFISVLILVIITVYVESNHDRILHYSDYKEHPIMRLLTIYGLFGMTYFWISYYIEGVVKNIKSWIKK